MTRQGQNARPDPGALSVSQLEQTNTSGSPIRVVVYLNHEFSFTGKSLQCTEQQNERIKRMLCYEKRRPY